MGRSLPSSLFFTHTQLLSSVIGSNTSLPVQTHLELDVGDKSFADFNIGSRWRPTP
jgi:hypothetical protein